MYRVGQSMRLVVRKALRFNSVDNFSEKSAVRERD